MRHKAGLILLANYKEERFARIRRSEKKDRSKREK